ncbi:thermonuclease family protein [Heyndrickxia oleronia]|uniref:thermonuclease family protein n=1 Tax=Heyndrickxia oleronia TaxID=38875 RepID=UPI000904170C|nr:thermonuclease family protein [Heyndrickxia oleronia]OJH18359.1 hypothetical protein BLX88_13745 [Bacillus obstructivus]
MSKRKFGGIGFVIAVILVVLVYKGVINTPEKVTNSVQVEKTQEDQNKKADNISNEQKNGSKGTSDNQRVSVQLTRTVDGDTIKVLYKGKEETVRYLLIDTPESKKPGTCVQPYAKSASEKNEQLVSSGDLSLEFDNGNERDKYGRLLAYVFVDGKSVQETLLKEGYARVAYIYEPTYKYLDQFKQDEKIAQERGSRIWSNKGLVTDRGFNGCATDVKKSSTNH